jgi:predicted Abi (CAAX) family protease
MDLEALSSLPFVQLPFVQLIIHRLAAAGGTIPDVAAWGYATLLLLIYTLLALPVAFGFGFIRMGLPKLSWWGRVGVLLGALATPAISEEVVFRVLLLPHPAEAVAGITPWLWGSFSLILFILYHPANAYSFFPAGRQVFIAPIFLSLAALLGVICTLSYLQSGSLWPPVFLHWIIVVVWLLLLGGYDKLHN